MDQKNDSINSAKPKLGLSLSGGGFRASLFHIGVLARLAELNLLKDIAVISTVSGGSILGAYYYLKLKQLLEGKRTDFPAPNRAAYITIVQEIEVEFLAAVQKNLRMRALWDCYQDARMFLSDDYSRSDRMADMYNKHIYLPLWRQITGHPAAVSVLLKDIKIEPPEMTEGFNLSSYNASAEYKIPALILNATCLNTGHPWHFTSSWVGEPDALQGCGRSIDTNVTLQQLRFDGMDRRDETIKRTALADADHEAQRAAKLATLSLSHAVAASACVPGIFTPLPVHNLYWNSSGQDIVVELVDGGVFDNQGIDALYAAGCTQIICSDASGQLEDALAPSSATLSVITRSNDVMMDRIRDDGYTRLYHAQLGDKLLHDVQLAREAHAELRCSWGVDKFAFFHLRESFKEQPGYPAFPGPIDRATDTTGHVYRLSNLRTDLDTFSDVEAYSLMYDGYGLSNSALFDSGISTSDALPARNAEKDPWKFLQITPMLDPKQPAQLTLLLKHLSVGKEILFRVFRLGDPLGIAVALVIAGIVAALLWTFRAVPVASVSAMSFSVGSITVMLLVAAGLYLLKALSTTKAMKKLREGIRWFRLGHRIFFIYALLAALLLVVSLAVTLALLIYNPLYLRAGKVKAR